MRFTGKLALKVGAVGVAAGAILTPATAALATGPTLLATPNTGLANADVVAVTGAGFAATAAYNMVQCSGPAGPSDCDLTNIVSGTTDGSGNISTNFTVHTGTIGAGTCAAGSTTCFLAASTDGGVTSGVATLSFKFLPTVVVTPNTGLHDGDTVSVTGTHFAATAAYSLVECSSPGLAGCDIPNVTGGTTDGDGSFTHSYVVHTGAIGTGACAEGSSTCIMAASTDGGGADSGAGSIAFAAAPAGPAVTVTPATGVKDGSKVKVTGTGFPANQPTVYVLECSGTTGQAACDIGSLATSSTNGEGSFTAKVKVHTGTVGNGTCKPGGKCYIAAASSQTPDETNSASGTFKFAKGSSASATKTVAKYSAKASAIAGKVTSGGKGVKGLKEKLEIKNGKHWKTVDSTTSKKGGKFAFKKVNKGGTYDVKTIKTAKYKGSKSGKVKV